MVRGEPCAAGDEMTPTELARMLSHVAADLESRGYGNVGVIRVAARELSTMRPAPKDDACGRCGDAVVQPATGRRKRWCSARCRRAAFAGT